MGVSKDATLAFWTANERSCAIWRAAMLDMLDKITANKVSSGLKDTASHMSTPHSTVLKTLIAFALSVGISGS